MTPEIVAVALMAGLAGGVAAALVMGALQAWMARGKSRPVFYRGGAAPSLGPTPMPPPSGQRYSGMGPFDRFTDRGKRILALAQDEAIRFNHNYMGTEHLLLALVREGESVAAQTLTQLGIRLDKVRSAVEFIIGRGDSTTSPSEITLSPRTKKVIELAIDEARRMGDGHVGPEHILLGLVREGEGIASGVIGSLGIQLPQVRAKVFEILQRAPPAGYSYEADQPGRRPFDRFGHRSKRTLAFAQDEAVRMGHRHIGTEHLFIGLARMAVETEDPLKRVFDELKLTLEQLRGEVAKLVPPTEPKGPPREITLSPRVKRAIDLSVSGAGPDRQIEPEHLLLAIVTEGEGMAVRALTALGVTRERVREVVRRPGESAA